VTSIDLFRADADILEVAKFKGVAGKSPTWTRLRADQHRQDIWGAELKYDKLIPS